MKELIRSFKALSDPTRLRIFRLLLERDLCVCELMFILGMSQSRISHQMRLLRDADLVEDRREGRWIVYAVSPGAKEALEPVVRRFAGPGSAGAQAALMDMERLDLCVRGNVRKGREAPREGSAA
jgi:ArsR family transcriptional regulator